MDSMNIGHEILKSTDRNSLAPSKLLSNLHETHAYSTTLCKELLHSGS
jgi:hypothetical protein